MYLSKPFLAIIVTILTCVFIFNFNSESQQQKLEMRILKMDLQMIGMKRTIEERDLMTAATLALSLQQQKEIRSLRSMIAEQMNMQLQTMMQVQQLYKDPNLVQAVPIDEPRCH